MRPIGAEFWGEWSFDDHSNDSKEIRVKYRVVEIVKVLEFGDFGKPIDAERLESIEIEYRPHKFVF